MGHGMPMWFKGLLAVHVAAGMLSFVMAPLALAFAKGGRQHRLWGNVYFWGMCVTTCTALPLALFRPVLFLALVSVLSFYLCFSGVRVLRLKAMARGGSAGAVDWIAAVLTFGCCAGLAGLGWFRPHAVQNMGVVAMVLGGLGMRLTVSDMVLFWRKPTDKLFWWYGHLGKFLASYISAWTAFSAATLSHVFRHAGIILWLWPAAIGVPAIALTTMYYQRKFAGRAKAAAPKTAVQVA